MKFNTPDKIIVYYNSNSNNIVFEPGDNEYFDICNMLNDAHKQAILTSILNGQLFKDVKVVEHSTKQVDYNGFKVGFVYNSPQIAKLENKIYSNNVWYKVLLFDVDGEDAFKYNSCAIISPESSALELYNYNAHYLSYSNLNNLYHYLTNMFN